jgi:MIT (microtubule interacting and transport) domain
MASQRDVAMDQAMTALEQALSKDGAAGASPGEAAALYRKSIEYFEEVLSAVQDTNERDVLSEEINSYKRRAEKLEAEQLKVSETEQARQRLQAASLSPRALPVPPQAANTRGDAFAQSKSIDASQGDLDAQAQSAKPGRVSAPPAPLAALDRTPAAVAAAAASAAAASAAAHRSLPQKSTRITVAQQLQQHLCSIPAARPKSPGAAAAASSGEECLSSASSCCSYGSSDEEHRSACGSGSDSGKQRSAAAAATTAGTAAAGSSPTGNSKRSSWGRPQRSAKQTAPQRRPQKHTSRLSLGPSSPEAVPTPRKRESNKKGVALTSTTAAVSAGAAAGVVAIEGTATAPSTPVAAAAAPAAAVTAAGFAVVREGAEEDRVEGEGELCCCGLLRIRYIESMYDICIKPVKVSCTALHCIVMFIIFAYYKATLSALLATSAAAHCIVGLTTVISSVVSW